MGIGSGITQPAHSKNEKLTKIEKPNISGDLSMIIGIFIFYIQSLPLYDLYIRPLRYIFLKHS